MVTSCHGAWKMNGAANEMESPHQRTNKSSRSLHRRTNKSQSQSLQKVPPALEWGADEMGGTDAIADKLKQSDRLKRQEESTGTRSTVVSSLSSLQGARDV